MSQKVYEIKLLLFFTSLSLINAQFSVSVERPCPMETVTFTCTAPGDTLLWETTDPAALQIGIRNSTHLNVSVMPLPGYTVTQTAFTDTTMTSTLSSAAMDGITVSCLDELTLTTIGSTTVNVVDPPSIMPHSIESSSVDAVSVTVQWDPPTDNGGRDDLTYTVTVSPPTQLSATVLTSTSCPVLTNPTNGAFSTLTSRLPGSTATLQCDAGYNPSSTMLMCLDTLMWSVDPEAIECTPLTAPPPTSVPTITAAPLSTGAAVAITGVITFIVALVIGLLIEVVVTYKYLCVHKKAVYSPTAEGQANVGPTAPAGPVYEEVSPKEEIELNTKNANGPV